MRGLEALVQLQRMPAYEHVPMVMLTTIEDWKLIHKSIQLDAGSLLTKPKNQQELTNLLRSLTIDWGLD